MVSQRGGIFFRLLFLLCFIAVLFALYLVRVPLLKLAGNSWIVNEAPQPSDAIVILGDDNLGSERAKRAAELFKAGWAPRLIASGRYLRPYLSIPELMQRDLTGMGVPPGAIVQFPHHAGNTAEEAFALSKFLSARGWKRIIVVTSNYHTRRSRYIYEHALPAGTQLRFVAARDSGFDPDSWWRSYRGIKIFVHETAGYLAAMWAMRNHEYDGGASAPAKSEVWQGPVDGLILCEHDADLHLVPAVLWSDTPFRMPAARRRSPVNYRGGVLMWRKRAEIKALRSAPGMTGVVRIKPKSTPMEPAAPAPIGLQVAPRAESPEQIFPEPADMPAITPADSSPSMISAGLKFRGEFFGSSDLFIDGEAQGKIRVPGARVTIGSSGRVVADIDAREIIVDGTVQGNLKASENIRLGPSSRVQGSMVTMRIGIEDGARLRGKIEMTRLPDSQGMLAVESPLGSEAFGKVSGRAENE